MVTRNLFSIGSIATIVSYFRSFVRKSQQFGPGRNWIRFSLIPDWTRTNYSVQANVVVLWG